MVKINQNNRMNPIVGTRQPIRCYNCTSVIGWQLKVHSEILAQKYWCTSCVLALETFRSLIMQRIEERRQIFWEINHSDILRGVDCRNAVLKWFYSAEHSEATREQERFERDIEDQPE